MTLFRPGLPPFVYQSIEANDFNAIPSDTPAVMSFSGLTLNFRACHNGFTEDSGVGFPDDCPFAFEGGFGMSYNINPPGGWASAADGSGDTLQCSGVGVSGCRVTDLPIATARWNLRVHLDGDYDGDGILDGDDAFPSDPDEWDDTDGDGIGNNADTDDDGDGMPDDYEIANGLDPLNAADAAEDADGDGFTNLEEFEAGTDPQDAADFPSPRMAPVSIFILLDDEGQ